MPVTWIGNLSSFFKKVTPYLALHKLMEEVIQLICINNLSLVLAKPKTPMVNGSWWGRIGSQVSKSHYI